MVDVGVALISRFGAKALSLTSVARSAGVARATAYRMFGGKDALIAAIMEREVATLRVKLREWSELGDTPVEKVRSQVLHVLPYIREHEALQYILRKEPEEVVSALVAGDDDTGGNLIHLIVEGGLADLETEVADAANPDPRGAAEFMVRVIYSLMLIPQSSLTDEQVADLVVRAIIR